MADRPTRLTQPEPEPESDSSLYPGQAPVSRYLFLSVLSAGMYISHLIDGSGRSWCTVYTGVLLWQRRKRIAPGLALLLWAPRPQGSNGTAVPCIFFLPSPGGYVRTNEDPHGRQRNAGDRQDACVYGVSNIWRLRFFLGGGGAHGPRVSVGGCCR